MTTTENTTWAFGDWWQLLNEELADQGQSKALYGDARYFHTANYSPYGAARLITEDRQIAVTTENTTWAFGDWWQLLNEELADQGQSKALYGDARYFHTANYSPYGAARLITEDRQIAVA